MNKAKVVAHLNYEIRLRFHGCTNREIERDLMNEGWSIGAIREALCATAHVPTNDPGLRAEVR
ncbi:MAG: hypothetical protein AAGP08_18660 [Pseudomonadota bacterium]